MNLTEIQKAIRQGLRSLEAPPPLRLSQWAEHHFYLSAESSYVEGSWKAYPYQIGILDAISNDDIEEVTFRKSARVGYALALDTPIPTAHGWTTMGDIKVGECVFDEAGRPCTVTYVSPVYEDHHCYRVTFCDGSEIVADAGHRWYVESDLSFEYLRGERGKGRVGRPKAGETSTRAGVVDTHSMSTMLRSARGRTTLAIPVAGALECQEAALPIPPYLLGQWLGDGHAVTPRITLHRDDAQEVADYISSGGVTASVHYIDARYPNNATIFLDLPEGSRKSPWAAVFRANGLLANKHIPEMYLRASKHQRIALLQGLMDSDGTVREDGFCEIALTIKALADGVADLLGGLGVKYHRSERCPRLPHHLTQYRVRFSAPGEFPVFKLARKLARTQRGPLKPQETRRRRVVSVELVPSVPVRCISVDSPRSLFLAGRTFIPTHNTKMIVAAMGYFAHHKRRNQAVWQPTDDDADEFVKTELDTMLRDVPAMAEVFPAHLARDKRNTLRAKVFLGSILHIRGGKAAKNYRRLSVDVAILDELDGFDLDIEKEGSPDKLAKKRTEGATFPKQIMGSTPKLKGFSRVEAREQQSDARFRYYIPCPHCGEEHTLEWGGKDKPFGFKWANKDPETVAHVCPHCGSLYHQADYLSVWRRGRWIAEDGIWIDDSDGTFRSPNGERVPALRSVAFFVWTAYSPQAPWSQIVREFLSAKEKAASGDTSELKTFVNTTLGETWEEEVEKTEAEALSSRAEPYPLRIVPRGGLVLVAGVDVQGDRFEVVVWAIGRGEEMWVVDYSVIYANPADEREWEEKLDPYLEQRFRHAGGQTLGIEAAAVDTGGNYTHQAYNFCRTRSRRRIYAIKGDTKQAQPVKGRSSLQDVNYRGATVKRGVRLWMVGTDTAKDLIFGRLNVVHPGPGYMHFSKDLPNEFYEQLTAEVRVLQRTAQGEQYRWVNRRKRNEVLDCTVYAIFSAHMLDLNRYTDKMWTKLEQAVCPPVADLFAPPEPSSTPGSEPPASVPLVTAQATSANPAPAGFVVYQSTDSD